MTKPATTKTASVPSAPLRAVDHVVVTAPSHQQGRLYSSAAGTFLVGTFVDLVCKHYVDPGTGASIALSYMLVLAPDGSGVPGIVGLRLSTGVALPALAGQPDPRRLSHPRD